MDFIDYIAGRPEVLWLVALIGAVCTIGLVDFLKCWIHGKQKTKWIVLAVSLAIAVVLSKVTPPIITTVVILWLLILSLSTITRNVIVDGMPALIAKIMGSYKRERENG